MFFDIARRKKVAIIARVPLASGLLSGKFRADTKFADSDHRQFNRKGEAFDVGENFSGVPYEVGLAARRENPPFSRRRGDGAIRVALDPDVRRRHGRHSRRRNAAQARSNAEAAALPALSPETMAELKAIYDREIKPFVHQRW